MKPKLKIIVCLLATVFVITCCDTPVGSESDGLCYYIGEDGQIHRYVCNNSSNGGGGTYNSGPIRVAVHLPDTAKNCFYGVFFITDITTYNCIHVVRGKCDERTYFFVYSSPVDSICYLAVLVSKTQKSPIKFTPAKGDFLGWYGGQGIYPGEKCYYAYPDIPQVYLEEVK